MHSWIRRSRALARHRLIQFFAIGGAIFAFAPRPRDARQIVIPESALQSLAAADVQKLSVPTLDDAAVRAMEERAVEDEILYREGVRLGLDAGDAIVRQRVIQKVLFLAEELDGATRPPAEDELHAFYAAHSERWRRPERFHLKQRFAHDRATLEAGGSEPGPLPSEMDSDVAQIRERLGDDCAKAIAAVEVGTWSAPVASPFGFHSFDVITRSPGGVAPFEEVRIEVVEVHSVWRREEAVAKFLSKAVSEYRVTVGGKPIERLEMPRRVAFRTDPSGED